MPDLFGDAIENAALDVKHDGTTVRSMVRIAAEHAGKAAAGIDLAIESAEKDVTLARLIPALSRLASSAHSIELDLRRMLDR